jgi:hypothetical protein
MVNKLLPELTYGIALLDHQCTQPQLDQVLGYSAAVTRNSPRAIESGGLGKQFVGIVAADHTKRQIVGHRRFSRFNRSAGDIALYALAAA